MLVMLQRSTMGQVEMNLEEKNLNSSLDSSDNSSYCGEEERNIGFWTENTRCTPGKRPDPGSCSRYFFCVEIRPDVFREYALYCPPHLVFNRDTSECDSPFFYQCADRLLPRPPLHRPYPRPPLYRPRPWQLRTPPIYPTIWPTTILPTTPFPP
jgi:hypothetical protein